MKTGIWACVKCLSIRAPHEKYAHGTAAGAVLVVRLRKFAKVTIDCLGRRPAWRSKIHLSVNKPSTIEDIARQTLRIEAAAVARLVDSIDADFLACVRHIHTGTAAGGAGAGGVGSDKVRGGSSPTPGRVVVTGIGKSALIAQKIVATLNSTGTPALFLHAADAIHGDIGMVQPNDLVLCLSKSGETEEVRVLALLVRNLGNPVAAMVGRRDSALAHLADYVLLTPVAREADPNDLAPTASTTSQLALGDALAMSLLALRGFSPDDFARFHPGGSLGKQLYLRVRDLYPKNQRPLVGPQTPLHETLLEMTAKCLGATAVVDPTTDQLLGIVTDGDLRRRLTQSDGHLDATATAADLMNTTPKTIRADELAVRALSLLRQHSISQLIVVGATGNYLGFVHLHDLVREGLV